MNREKPNPKANKSVLAVTYMLLAVFVCMIGYFGYFVQIEGKTVINNSYNARLDLFAERVIRGEIQSRDGQMLAGTETVDDGTEIRVYPFGSLFAHAVGYSNPGKTGLEALASFYLLSSHENAALQLIHELSGRKNVGDNVVTTLDVDLQKAASDALGGRTGAVIVMEPDTGKILAMVSEPGFDPNTLSEDWNFLISGDNTDAQLLNRAAQGVYPPGSVFKIVTLLEYLREHPDDWRDYSFDCGGIYDSGTYTISCYHSTAHGHQNIGEAFAKSCNGAFASLGLTLDQDAMRELTAQLLFNAELPVSMEYSRSSYAMGSGADEWEILQTSIGQGSTQMTPMHVAMITAAVANGGLLMKPYLIDHVESAAGDEVKKFTPEAYGTLMTAREAEIIGTAMRMVVTEGTASAVDTEAYEAAGKTGSAEFETGKETHAWFTGYAPLDNPQIVVTVIVEESGSGGAVAAPIARAVFDTYFSR
ncbi:MAG: penicillin-binding protein 2 [Clostridiales bacterium]|nr:penicillin-binding protein 2 [Clostridiales bacterium]